MVQNVKKIWESDYKPLLTPTDEQPQNQPLRRQPSIMEQYLRQAQVPQVIDHEFDSYINGPPTIFATPHDCIPWLFSPSKPWPGITQHALDLLFIPAMSAEPERVFSQAKLTVTPIRNDLSDHVIEILELPRYW